MDEVPHQGKILSLSEWESMYERLVERAGVTAKTLNSFDQISHKAQVYGEAMPLLVDALIDIAHIKPTDVFFDIGSGIGNIVLQIAAQTGCKSYGIEIREDLHNLAEGLLTEFNKEYAERNMKVPEVKFIGGDALSDSFEIDQYYVNSTVVFMNNWCFPPSLEQGLCLKFEAMLQKDVKVIALKNLFPREEPWKQRYRDAPVQIFKMPWERYKFPEGCISWAHRPITAYIYTVDREFDFDKKVAFFDAQWKKNKNYKGRVTHTVHFNEGKMQVKEVDETEEKHKKQKENKLPKVNDFIDLVGSPNRPTRLRDGTSTGNNAVKVPRPKPQPGVNGAPAPPRRKFRRRGKTPFLTDRDGDDYICLTCKAKDREPWRFKMSQQIAAHVRLHQFNPYRFGEGEDDGEEEEEMSVNNTNANPNVPLIDISNEKSVQKNGAEAEFAALISLMAISQPSAMQLDPAPPTIESVVEQAPVNNENTQSEKVAPPISSKKPGELNMRSRLTDSLNIDPAEIQRTRNRLAEKEKEATKANGEVIKPKKPKTSVGNGNPKEGTEEKKKSGDKPSQANGLKTSKDKSKKPLTTTAPTLNDTPKPAQQPAVNPEPTASYIIIDGQSFQVFPNGDVRPVSLRRATAHEPKSKRIVDNFPELPSERRIRKSNPKSKNANETSEKSESNASEDKQQNSTEQTAEDSRQQDHTNEQPVEDSTNGTNDQPPAQSALPLINTGLHTALIEQFSAASETIPGLDFQGIPPAVIQHVNARSLSPLPTINGLKHAPQPQESQMKSNETAKIAEANTDTNAQSPLKRPINSVNKVKKTSSSNLVDALPVVKSSNPDVVAKRANELTKSDEAWRTKRANEQSMPEEVDQMEIVRDEPASETTPTVAPVEQAAQMMDVTPTTEVPNGAEGAAVSSTVEQNSEQGPESAVDELPTAEITASHAEAHRHEEYTAQRIEVAQEPPVQSQQAEQRPDVEESPNVAPEVHTAIPMAMESRPEEAAVVPEVIVTPAVSEPLSAHVLASSEEKSVSERESVIDEESASTSKKRKRTPSTNEKPDQGTRQDDSNDDANSTLQSAQPKPKKRRFETELSGLFHGQINYDYKVQKEYLYSSKRSCVVKKETTAAAPKTPSRPMTSSPQPRARSRKAGATDPVLKTPPVSPIKFELKDEEERSTSAKPKPKTKKSNNNNNTNKDPEPNNNNVNKPATKDTKKTTEKTQTTTNTTEETPEVNANTTNKAPARPRSKSKTKPKDLAESILAKVSNLTPIKNAAKNLPKPKLPSKSKNQSASRSESPSTSCPPSPSKPAPLARNTSTAAALLLLAEKELIESSTVQALHSTNALIPEALPDNEQIALSAVMMTTDMEIIDTAAQHDQREGPGNQPAERQVVDISGQVDAEPERMIDIAGDTDAREAPVSSEIPRPIAHVDSTPAPEHRVPVNGKAQRAEAHEAQNVSGSRSVNEHSVGGAEVEPMSDQSVDQTMNISENDKLLNQVIEAHVISGSVVPEADSAQPINDGADPAPVTNMSMLQSIEYLKTSGLVEPAGTVDVLPDNEEQSSYFATIANYQDVEDDEDDEDDDILLLPTDS